MGVGLTGFPATSIPLTGAGLGRSGIARHFGNQPGFACFVFGKESQRVSIVKSEEAYAQDLD